MHINTPDLLQNGSPRWLPRGPPDPSSIYSTRQVGRLLRPALPRALELKACASMSAPACEGCGDEEAVFSIDARSISGYPAAAGSHRAEGWPGSFSGCTPPRATGRPG